MRGVRAVIVCLLAALALSGCMRTTAPVAVAQPQSDLDAMAYGQSYAMAPAPPPWPSRRADAGGLYDAAYKLDAGDRLRVVVYGQEGLTNTYAIDAGGAITMPLIGAVPRADGRRRALPRRSPPNCATATSAIPRWRWRSNPTGRSSSSAKSPPPANIPSPQHERRERGGDCRRLLAARPARPRHADPHRRFGFDARVVPLGTALGPGDTVLVGERWF